MPRAIAYQPASLASHTTARPTRALSQSRQSRHALVNACATRQSPAAGYRRSDDAAGRAAAPDLRRGRSAARRRRRPRSTSTARSSGRRCAHSVDAAARRSVRAICEGHQRSSVQPPGIHSGRAASHRSAHSQCAYACGPSQAAEWLDAPQGRIEAARSSSKPSAERWRLAGPQSGF